MNTLANKITIARICLIPVFLTLAYFEQMIWCFIIYVIACVSDFVDGYIARHYHQVSVFGKFMDPLADKMLVLAAMCYFIDAHIMPGWAVAIIIFREFSVSGLRLVAAQKNIVIAAAKSGKVKTACTMIGLGAMLLFPSIFWITSLCTVLILATTLYSGLEYFKNNYSVLFQD